MLTTKPFLIAAAAAVLLVLVVALPSAVHAAPYSVDPATPIVGVPFRVTDVGSTPPPNTFVFISQFSNCTAMEAGTLKAFNPNAVTFTVAANTKQLFMCLQATSTMLLTINVERARLFPTWAPVNQAREIDVIPAVPSGAVVNFHQFGSCSSTILTSINVNPATNKVSWPPTGNVQYFPCLKFTDAITSVVQNIQMGRFETFSNLAFTPNVTIMQKTETFYVTGVSGGPVRWAANSDCSGVVSKDFALGFSNDFTTLVTTAKGVYHFCWDSSVGFGNFISIGTIQIKKFDSLPRTAFINAGVSFQLTGDSPRNTNFIVADALCVDNFLGYQLSVNPSTGIATTAVTFTSTATHYICVQEDNLGSGTPPFILADRVSIINLFSITQTPTVAVRGLPTTVSANVGNSPASSTFFASPDTTCNSQYANFTTTNWVGQLIMPTSGFGSAVSAYTMCAFTADATSRAALPGLYSVRDYVLQLNVPVAGGIDRTVVLDTDTPMPANFYLSAGSSCGPKHLSLANYTFSLLKADNIQYPTTGQMSICLQSTATTVSRLQTVTVLPLASFTPAATFQSTVTTVSIANVAEAGAYVMIISATTYAACPAYPGTGTVFVHNSSAPAAGTYTIQVPFAAVGAYRVCLSYQNIKSGRFFAELGIMNVVQATVTPKHFVAGGISWVRVVIPASYGPVVVQSLYLSNSATCADVLPTAYPTSANGTAQIPVTVTAGLPTYVCFRTENMTNPSEFGVAEAVTVFPQMSFTHPQTYAKVYGIPFQIVFPNPGAPLWGYWPAQFFLSTDPNICANSAASGTITAGTGLTPAAITLTATSLSYSVCVTAPTTGSGFLRAGPLTVAKFTAVSRTFIHGVSPVVTTSPVIPFAFFLTGSSDCQGGTTRYYLTPGTALPATTPASNVFFLCAYDAANPAAWVSPSANTVAVVGAFSAILPSPVRGEVPFTATFTTDVQTTPGAMQYAYLIAGLNQQCIAASDARLGGTYGGTSTTQVTLKVPTRTNVTVCALSADNSTAAAVGSIVPLPYTSPSEVVKTDTGPVRILLGDGSVPAGATVYLTRDNGCTFPDLGTFTVKAGGFIDVPVPTTSSVNAQQFVCLQLTAGGQIVLKDWLYVWDSFGATTITVIDNGFKSWDPSGRYWPGVPIRIGLPPNLHSPFLAHSKNCSGAGVVPSAMLAAYGVFPTEGENTTYFICAVTSRGTLVASPDAIQFVNFQFIPQRPVTDLLQSGYLFPPIARFATTAGGIADPFGGLYWSRDSTCNAGAMIAGPTYTNVSKFVIPGGDGMVYTCVFPGGGNAPVAIASHMYYRRAAMTVVSAYPIAGLPYCMQVTIPFPALWNQMEGVPPVTGPVTARRWFLATARSNCSAPIGAQVKLGNEIATFCLETNLLTSGASYDVCGPTPNGAVPYLMDRVFSYVLSNNTGGYVYGAPVVVPTVTVPVLPATTFGWAIADCANARKAGPDFVTDAFGFKDVDFRVQTAFVAPTYDAFVEGYYWLCMKFETFSVATSLRREAELLAVVQGQFYGVGRVWIGRVHQYSVSSSRIVSLVPTTVELMQDLHFAYLAGISTDPQCRTLDTTSVRFDAVAGTTRQAVVTTTVALGGSLGADYFLCARGPVNNTIVPVQPLQKIYTSDFVHQNSESACQTFVVGYANPTGLFASAIDSVVTLARGPCCPSSGTQELLSRSTRVAGSTPLHSFFVTSQEITRMNGTQFFSLCYASAGIGVCLAAGQINITQALCGTTLVPSPATTNPNALPLAPNTFLGFSASSLTGNAVHDAAILGAILFFVILVVLVLCCLMCYRRGIVPPEDADNKKRQQGKARTAAGAMAGGDDGYNPEDANSFQELFRANREKSAVLGPMDESEMMLMLAAGPHNNGSGTQGGGGIDVYAITAGLPLNPMLDMCHEPTNDTLAAEAEERRERDDLLLCEQFLFEKMRRAYVTELRGLSAVAVGSDRTRMIREGNNLLREARERFCDIEEEHRAEIERQEQEEMYDIAVADQEGYRAVAGHERDALSAVWQGEEESWSARRERLLRSGHGRAIEAAEAAQYAENNSHNNNNDSYSTRNVVVSPASRLRNLVGPAGAAGASNNNNNNNNAFSPREDQPPPPPSIEPLMTSPAHPGMTRNSYARNSNNNDFSSVSSSQEFRDPLGSLPAGPAPSPPPLAIRGDPLLHFTVPAVNNSMLNRSLPSPSARGGAGAAPGELPSPQRNPLHHPLTPGNATRPLGYTAAAHLSAPITPPHVADRHFGSYSGNNLDDSGSDQLRAYYPSHASRPAMGAGAGNNNSSRHNNNGGVRWGGGGGGAAGAHDPSDFEVYRAPRR